MIKINLLPFRAARTKENIRRQISVFLLSLVLVAFCFYWFSTKLSARIVVLEDQAAQKKIQITAYQKRAAEVDKIKKQLDLLKSKTEIVGNLERGRREPVHLLATLTEMVVENRMWLTDLATKSVAPQPPKPKAAGKKRRGRRAKAPAKKPEAPKPSTRIEVKLKGFALDNKTIADFMERLEGFPRFADVALVNIEHRTVQEASLKSFGINFTQLPEKRPEVGPETKAP